MPPGDRLDRFLTAWERDAAEGITLRSVANQVRGLRGDFEKHRTDTRDRLTKLETRNEETDKREQIDAIGTGRHQVLAPATPVQAFPVPLRGPVVPPWGPNPTPAWGDITPPMQALPPPPPERSSQATIVIETKSSRESGFFGGLWKKLKKYLSHSIAVFLAAMFTLGMQWLAGHGCTPAQKVQSLEKPAGSAATLR